MIISIIGSGGKTTLVKQMANTFQSQEKKVLVTTSTHMFIEPQALLTDDTNEIIHRLQTDNYVIAGRKHDKKMAALSQETYDTVCSHADVVLVEADGSRHLPIKYPNDTEPVIYDNTEHVILVCGMHALGHPASQVAHRLELVMQCLGIDEDTIITPDHISQLLQEGYIKPLQEKYPHVTFWLYPALTHAPDKTEEAAMILEDMAQFHVRAFDLDVFSYNHL